MRKNSDYGEIHGVSNKKYQEFHDKPTPEEHHLQHLRMVLLGSMLAITILQKGPKAIYMLSELLK